VAEAADALGITVDAVRSRLKRGTIDHERKGGRVYVLLGADEARPGHNQDTDQVSDQGARESEDRTAELITTLREQLQAERQAHAEARRLLAAALERIPPQLEAPSEVRESDVSPEPTGELGELREELDTERTRRQRAESTLREGMDEEQRRREKAERERDELREELYARREPRQSPQTSEEQQVRGQPHPATVEAQAGVRRPWWRRIFGG
jgi:predicted  nucleic acid-binding Zn-ribbon protein